MGRLAGLGAGLVLAAAIAAPVAAQAPVRETTEFTTDPYVFATCDGYDVMEQLDARLTVDTYFDANGDVLRAVTHSSTTGNDWRSDTGAPVATFSDIGGTFTATADGTFTWTGNHSSWTLVDGSVIKFVGRIVVREIEPGTFERTFAAGSFDDLDPCAW